MLHTKQRGAVSIFIVIFTSLLVTIVTTGFIQIMMRNQQQATNNDLSQSAYDSALAGVEDAKRALVKLKKCQQTASPCASAVESALRTETCESLGAGGAQVATFNQGEVQVGDATLNQAYTCVKVQLVTDFIEGELTGDSDINVVRLKGTSNFDRIRLSWFTADDLPIAANGVPSYTALPSGLPDVSTWPDTQPALMRAQLIQFSQGNLRLSNFDATDSANAKTRFLFPSLGGVATTSFNNDNRRDTASRNRPVVTSCANNFTSDQYLCSITMTVPAMANREAYLQLASYYNATHYKIELFDGGTHVRLDGVQPIVDATGRASDLFRRVKARLSVSNGGAPVQFPDAALSVGENVCKDFFITNQPGDYNPDTDLVPCSPAVPVGP